ncbi:MAG: lamin tail domain-containing protein [Patescibacteria group bacterium]
MYYKLNKTKLGCQALLIGLFWVYPVFCLAATGDVLINEIAWMGIETATSNEWIELYNNSDSPIDIKDWSIYGADTEKCLNFSDADGNVTTIIPKYGYLIYANNEDNVKDVNEINIVDIWDTSIGMNNTSPGQIILYDTLNCQNDAIDIVNQTDSWLAGDNNTKQTMEWNGSTWQTSQDAGGTPKAQNSILSQQTATSTDTSNTTNTSSSDSTNHPPFAVAGPNITALTNQEILFDASESYDMNNDPITYFWNFGDGATDIEEQTTHTYTYPGQYLVSLLVSDGTFSDLDIITINIYERSVIINEFSNKWIELYNQSDQIANLTDWQLTNGLGSSSPFIFPANSLIGPKQFLILKQEITKIDLSSSNDQISLIYPDGSVGTKVSYLAENREGFSIAFDGDDYFWTKVPTPGIANIISATNIAKESKSFSANNPEPIIEQTSLTPRDNFTSQESPTSSTQFMGTDSQTPQNNSQIAAISQSTQSNQKSTLILYLSIIISVSFLLSWIVIKIRNSRSV